MWLLQFVLNAMSLIMLKQFLLIFGLFQMTLSQIDVELKMVNDIASTYEEIPYFVIFGYEKNDLFQLVSGLYSYGFQVTSYSFLIKEKLNLYPMQNGVFLLNFNTELSERFLNNANANSFFEFPLKWIIINNNSTEDLQTIAPKFQHLNTLVDSNVIVSTKIYENDTKYLLENIYKRHKNTDLIIERYAEWSKENGLQKLVSENDPAVRRNNLMGTVLRTAIVVTHNDTLNHLTDYREKHIDSITKVNYILMNHLASTINARLKFTIKSTWGYKTNTSSWTGMLGELTEDRADIGGTPLFVTSDRIDIIDYIAMTTATKSNFVFREPKLSYVTNVFTLPFHWTVWLSTIALVVITTVVLFIMVKWETYIKKGDTHLEPNDAVIVSFGAMCQQGASSLPDKVPGRIVSLLIFVSLMFLFTSYSANIVALLQSSSNSIQTLDDLLKSRLAVAVDDTVFNRFYFPAATEPVRRALYLQKVAPKNQLPRFIPIEKGVKLMRQGLFAFHMEGGSGYKIVGETFFENEKCNLQEIPFLQVPDPWLAIQKNSSYKEMLKIGLRKIQESGLQAREVSRIYTKKPQCHGTTSSFISVGLIDIYAAIVVFASGIVSATIVFVFELIVFRRMRFNCNHKQN